MTGSRCLFRVWNSGTSLPAMSYRCPTPSFPRGLSPGDALHLVYGRDISPRVCSDIGSALMVRQFAAGMLAVLCLGVGSSFAEEAAAPDGVRVGDRWSYD